MKKGVRIKKVSIDKGFVTAYDSEGNILKLTRGERNALIDYKSDNYIVNIQKVFGHKDILDDGFTVFKNGSKKIS